MSNIIKKCIPFSFVIFIALFCPYSTSAAKEEKDVSSSVAQKIYEKFRDYRLALNAQPKKIGNFFSRELLLRLSDLLVSSKTSYEIMDSAHVFVNRLSFGNSINTVYSYSVIEINSSKVVLLLECRKSGASMPKRERITFVEESGEWLMEWREIDTTGADLINTSRVFEKF